MSHTQTPGPLYIIYSGCTDHLQLHIKITHHRLLVIFVCYRTDNFKSMYTIKHLNIHHQGLQFPINCQVVFEHIRIFWLNRSLTVQVFVLSYLNSIRFFKSCQELFDFLYLFVLITLVFGLRSLILTGTSSFTSDIIRI